MKNPNGYGTVIKLGGKRRRPYQVKITVGYNQDGKQLKKVLGAFATIREANEFLVRYNKTPDLFINNATFSDVYYKWSESKFENISKSTIANYKIAFQHSRAIAGIKMRDIKTIHLQDVINEVGGYGTKKSIKNLFSQLFEYSMRNDIVAKDYSKFVDIGEKKVVVTRKPFTLKEIDTLWKLVDTTEWVDTVLILIYTGLRIGELLNLKNKDINLQENFIRAGSKTQAGINRLIPIHPKILPLIQKRISQYEYFILNYKNEKKGYSNYHRENFKVLMKNIGMEHTIHDTRHTFATLLNNNNANKTSITRLIGHSSFLTTEKVYSHKDIEELRKAIEII